MNRPPSKSRPSRPTPQASRPKPPVAPEVPATKAGPFLERRRSKIAGWGVYTRRPITKNSRIIHYAGEMITHKQSAKREARQVAKGQIWCFTVNRRWVRDAEVGGNIARFINHGCRPNCWVDIVGHVIWIRASRNIAKGEELTYDYSTDGDATIQCRCRPGCQRLL